MDHEPLVKEEIEAGAELVRKFDAGYMPVKAAFWLKASDNEYRYLYITSDQIDSTNFDLAYGEVIRLTDKMRSPHLDPFRVKVVAGNHPLAMAAAEVNEQFPSRLANRLGNTMFGGTFVDDVYVYPSPLPAVAT